MSGWFNEGVSADEIDDMPASTSATPNYPNLFWVNPDKDVKLVLLDDPKIMFYYHSLFVKGDKQAMKMKVACVDGGNSEPNPLKCPICNASLHDEAIGRRFGSLITAIDLTGYTNAEGEERKHLRRVLLLSHAETKKVMKMKKHYGGSIRGLQIEVSRSSKKVSSNGDHWQPLKKFKNLAKAFSKSPGVKFLFEAREKAGESISWEEAVERFITPADYQKLFEPSNERLVHFLTYRGHDPEEMMGKKPKKSKKKDKAPDVDFSLEDDDDEDVELIEDDEEEELVDEADDDEEEELVDDEEDEEEEEELVDDDEDEDEEEEEEAPDPPKKSKKKPSSPKKKPAGKKKGTKKKGTKKKTTKKKGTKKKTKKEEPDELDDFEDDLDDFDEP